MRDSLYEHGNEPIRVRTEGTAGPYLIVEPGQVDEVCELLRENGITFDVKPNTIRMDREPAGTAINFGLIADVEHIQAILDSVD